MTVKKIQIIYLSIPTQISCESSTCF